MQGVQERDGEGVEIDPGWSLGSCSLKCGRKRNDQGNVGCSHPIVSEHLQAIEDVPAREAEEHRDDEGRRHKLLPHKNLGGL